MSGLDGPTAVGCAGRAGRRPRRPCAAAVREAAADNPRADRRRPRTCRPTRGVARLHRTDLDLRLRHRHHGVRGGVRAHRHGDPRRTAAAAELALLRTAGATPASCAGCSGWRASCSPRSPRCPPPRSACVFAHLVAARFRDLGAVPAQFTVQANVPVLLAGGAGRDAGHVRRRADRRSPGGTRRADPGPRRDRERHRPEASSCGSAIALVTRRRCDRRADVRAAGRAARDGHELRLHAPCCCVRSRRSGRCWCGLLTVAGRPR